MGIDNADADKLKIAATWSSVATSTILTFTTSGAATFASSVTASSFIKTGGTSAQFLKADGSIDSNTYLTTGAASSTYLALAGGTMTGQIVLAAGTTSTDYTKGLRFPNDPYGGSGDTSGLRLYAETAIGAEAQVLELYIANDGAGVSQDRINFQAPSNDLVTINGNKIWNAGNLTPQTQLNGTGFVKANGTTISYDNSTYLTTSAAASTYVAKSGDTMTGTLTFSNDLGTCLTGSMATNDQWRIYAGNTGSNAGYLEIATADDSAEPIYVRQYTGVFGSLTRTATILDGSGNTIFPGTVTANSFFEGSDIRFKNVIETNPQVEVLGIDVIKFTRTDVNTNQIRFGYSAQQVKSVIPEAVTGEDKMSVNYMDVHTLKIAALEKRIAELEAKLNKYGI